jgi:hypothetical protein
VRFTIPEKLPDAGALTTNDAGEPACCTLKALTGVREKLFGGT